MRKTAIAIATLTLTLTFGCNKGSTPSAAAPAAPAIETKVAQVNMTPEELGELGAEIKKNPADANKLLTEKGLTEQSFEQAIRKVSESPEESKRYAAAYKRASA